MTHTKNIDQFDEDVGNAMAIIQEYKPESSPQRKAAFANCVAYLTTGVSGGYGGPSIREHAVGVLYAGSSMLFREAVKLCMSDKGPIFGPLTDLHLDIWYEESDICFDDDPQDSAELEKEL